MINKWMIGIIGGSGLYAIDMLQEPRWQSIRTPWGEASDEILLGSLCGIDVAFLPRHGRGHRIAPEEINARANIDALKRVGCTDILAISSVGSLREQIAPGQFVVVQQFIDRTVSRPASFFGTGLVAHISLAEPVCSRLSALAAAAIAAATGSDPVRNATYLAMEGPQFSSRAESRLFRGWGADVIGMTAMPEARLAREAELPYALVGMVTDYDCWREGEHFVEVSDVVVQMQKNAEHARRLVTAFLADLPAAREPSPLDTVLDNALITHPDYRDPALLAKLDVVCGRVLSR